ncbi:MAG: aminotransferase class IV [Pseudomonadota bacterium]|nr:branched-chain-amino acid aminotransferase [Gammaproteobacteria bacterium]MEE2684045.1 aminotransferase class IV [Pseudomonadota bacterium]|tara:strand:- start:406 stop:1335 length:930 start_codon:yes stop_codon:yes gene_type:complete
MKYFNGIANVNGIVSSIEKAHISIMDRGFLYGDSIYEVLTTTEGIPLFFDEHWDRFNNSAKLINLDIKISKEELFFEIKKLFSLDSLPRNIDFYIRYIMSRGEGDIDLFPDASLESKLIIMAKKVRHYPKIFYDEGIKLAIPRIKRNSTNSLNPNIKGGNYLNNILGLMHSRQLGADDCLMLNESGYITESSSSNIFFVIDDRIVTPSELSGNLRGITKNAIHKICSDNNIANIEIDLELEELDLATECFITSSTRGIMPVISLQLSEDNVINFPRGGGEYTKKLITFYKEYLEEYVANNDDLLLYQKI